jgi:DNA polymerase family A
MLYRLDQYKRAGKGLKSWFDDKYIGRDGYIHPRFVVTGTSTGRLSSSGPNFQNIPKVGFGSMVRAAIVPRSPSLRISKADKSQLELRICLFYAGIHEDIGDDAFTWLVQNSDGKFEKPAARLGYKPRDVAKSVSHAADYLEGLVILSDKDLASKRRCDERRAGALIVFDGTGGRPLWEYGGGVVAFTGGNLSERLFGDRRNEHRREALEIQEIYLERFPSIRRWHMELSAAIERKGRVVSHTGRHIDLYGSSEDNLKLAAAFLGQGGGADEVQEHMLKLHHTNRIAIIQVHDELVIETPREWTNEQVKRSFDFFCEPSQRFANIRFPIKISTGDNWGSYNESTNPGGCVEI